MSVLAPGGRCRLGGRRPARGPEQVGSADIINNEVQTADIKDANLTTADIRAGAVTSGKVADDTLTGQDIQNVTRSVNLPLTSFVNRNDAATLDFIPSNGTSPDLAFATTGLALVLEWDEDSDAGGADVADTDQVTSAFTIPADYVGGAPVSFALRAQKDGHSGVDERFSCGARHDDSGIGLADPITTTGARATYVIEHSGTLLAPGGTLELTCGVDDGSNGGSSADDVVFLRSVEFRYPATQ